MSKAEDRARDLGYWTDPLNRVEYTANDVRKAFVEGYHQAEQDLELTWEDMMIIHKCIKDAMNFHLCKMMEGVEGQKIVYEEILKRFKETKEVD